MVLIDIVSKIELTTQDGGVVLSGTTIKFSSLFHSGSNRIEITLAVYRSRKIMELGFSPVNVRGLTSMFSLIVPDSEFQQITQYRIHEMVRDRLNEIVGENAFEIIITTIENTTETENIIQSETENIIQSETENTTQP